MTVNRQGDFCGTAKLYSDALSGSNPPLCALKQSPSLKKAVLETSEVLLAILHTSQYNCPIKIEGEHIANQEHSTGTTMWSSNIPALLCRLYPGHAIPHPHH